ncbi:hypothetical protein F4820DRAFT_174281 [Hypoxylon rubiginosum]|uniref:Uncharacterized protein n=1 Tax=Hypoxylon rubiginosum TaxID=110542 RepID=A0ACB9YJF5_9PEZI|nr:hypothetical protein F4820DRAFT_174281 [Hypoxylon rubiginosum]
MLASFITVVSALAASAAALPGAVGGRDVYAKWPAFNFQEGCSPGGCIASFNISAPAGYVAGAPAFNVACHPIYIQQGWLVCDTISEATAGSSVESMWTGAEDRDNIKISVSHLWYQGETRYNASGNIEFAPGTTAFDIPVTLLSAVL